MIYVGIDDTDIVGSPGTNKLARALIAEVGSQYRCLVAVRHQLLFDPRVPYTSKNSSASLLFESRHGGSIRDLADRLRPFMLDWFVEGSDPGLCLTQRVPTEVTEFGQRCQTSVVRPDQARDLAARYEIHLEGLGGTEDGIIGALAAVGLVASGNDGRVINIGNHPDDLAGWQDVTTLLRRGIDEIRVIETDALVSDGKVDVGKHLRPNYRDRKIVLFVQQAAEEPAGEGGHQPVKYSSADTDNLHTDAESSDIWRAIRFT